MIRINKLITICILITFAVIVPQSSVFAVEQVTQKVELKENHSSLLNFDEKILRYKAGAEGILDIEILPDIYNQRHEMFIKPIKAVNTNLMVWTQTKEYNFNIIIYGKDDGSQGFSLFEIDLPPGL